MICQECFKPGAPISRLASCRIYQPGSWGCLLRLGSRSDRACEMRKIARINAKKKFCANDVIPAYENYYKRVLDES